MWTAFECTLCPVPSCPAFEPNLTHSEYSQPLLHIQYNRTPSLRAIATLAMFRCRRITTHCGLSCFHQQETQQRAALLGNAYQPLMTRAGIFGRNQSDIAADLLAAPKPFRSSDD